MSVPLEAYGVIEHTFLGVRWLPMGVGYSDRRKARRWARKTDGRFIVRRGQRPRYQCLVPVHVLKANLPPGAILKEYYYHPVKGQSLVPRPL